MAAVIVGSLAAPDDPALDELLGADGARALRAELAARARRWAAEVAPGRCFEATTLGAAEAALHGHDGPVLLAAPDVPALDQRLARAALDDLAAGCDIVAGRRARRAALHPRRRASGPRAAGRWSSARSTAGSWAPSPSAASRSGCCATSAAWPAPGDARALAIDPLAPSDLAALVRGRLREPPRR